MKKLLFRATKGKVLCKVCDDSPIDYMQKEGIKSKQSDKCVYVLVF